MAVTYSTSDAVQFLIRAHNAWQGNIRGTVHCHAAQLGFFAPVVFELRQLVSHCQVAYHGAWPWTKQSKSPDSKPYEISQDVIETVDNWAYGTGSKLYFVHFV